LWLIPSSNTQHVPVVVELLIPGMPRFIRAAVATPYKGQVKATKAVCKKP
jgi:hypothetical protein